MDRRSGLFVVMTSKYTNFRYAVGETKTGTDRARKRARKRERERERERRQEGSEKEKLLTIFSSINGLSITIQRVCPSVNATIMRWSVSVQLRSPGCSSSPVTTLFCLFIDSYTRRHYRQIMPPRSPPPRPTLLASRRLLHVRTLAQLDRCGFIVRKTGGGTTPEGGKGSKKTIVVDPIFTSILIRRNV